METKSLQGIMLHHLGSWLKKIKIEDVALAPEIADYVLELPITVLETFVESLVKDLDSVLENEFTAFCVIYILIKIGKILLFVLI